MRAPPRYAPQAGPTPPAHPIVPPTAPLPGRSAPPAAMAILAATRATFPSRAPGAPLVDRMPRLPPDHAAGRFHRAGLTSPPPAARLLRHGRRPGLPELQ